MQNIYSNTKITNEYLNIAVLVSALHPINIYTSLSNLQDLMFLGIDQISQ